jgi:hypothetical protein
MRFRVKSEFEDHSEIIRKSCPKVKQEKNISNGKQMQPQFVEVLKFYFAIISPNPVEYSYA